MRAMDVMTTNVITVEPDTSVQQLATLLSDRGISGVPVVDRDNRLVGVVSEGDLLHRAETGTERRTQRRRSRWLDSFASDQEAARDLARNETDQARAGGSRRPAGRHHQPGEPGAGTGDDEERIGYRGG